MRDGAILINLEAFKAIVKHNSLILFTTETARGTVLQQFCPFLQYRLTYVPRTTTTSRHRRGMTPSIRRSHCGGQT